MNLKKLLSLAAVGCGVLIFFVGILLGSFANIPGFYSYYTTTKYFAMVISGVLALAIIGCFTPVIKLPKSAMLYVKLFGLLLVFLVITIVFSTAPISSLVGQFTQWEFNLLSYILYALIFIGVAITFVLLKQSKLDVTLFGVLMTLLCVAAIIYGLGEFYIWKPQTGYISNFVPRISLGFRNPLFAAFLLGMLWLYSFTELVFAWIWQLPAKVKKVTNVITPHLTRIALGTKVIIFVLLTHVFVLTFTRSAWISAAVGAGLALGWAFLLVKRSNGIAIMRTSLTVGILLLSILMNVFLLRQPLSQRSENVFSEGQQTIRTIAQAIGGNQESAAGFFQNANEYSTMEIRLKEWQWGLTTLFSSPKIFLIGAGPDALNFVLPETRPAEFNNIPTDSFTRPTYIRNMYLTFILMHGALFTITAAVLAGVVGIRFVKRFLALSDTKKKQLVGPVFLLIGFLLQGIFYYPTFPLLVLIMFTLGYIVARMEIFSFSVQPSHLQGKLLTLFIAIIISIWTGITAYAEVKLDLIALYWVPTREILQDTDKIPVPSLIFKRIFTYHYPDTQESSAFLPELAKSKDLDDLRVAAAVYYGLGRSNYDLDMVNKSIEILETMVEKDPTAPVHYDELGLRYLFLQDYDKSREYFDKALSVKRDFWFTYMHMGELLRQTCNPKEALAWYEGAKPYVPMAADEILEAKVEIENPIAGCR
ncbi:MAG: tetratricopeptide repeat protein [Candidatus Dojkabacteria bacterium]|nr:MAG: tetratricopeptide repeat protein [Candidatus Dojkabacteria bacterium]